MDNPINNKAIFSKKQVEVLREVRRENEKEGRSREGFLMKMNKLLKEETVSKCLMHICQKCLASKEIEMFVGYFKKENSLEGDQNMEAKEPSPSNPNDTIEEKSPALEETKFVGVKLADLSFLRISWQPFCQISKKLSRFKDKASFLMDLDSLSRHQRLEKIVSCKIPEMFAQISFALIYTSKFSQNQFVGPENPSSFHFLVKWEGLSHSELTWEPEFLLAQYSEEIRRFFILKIKEEEMKRGVPTSFPSYFKSKSLNSSSCFPRYSLAPEKLKWFSETLQKERSVIRDNIGFLEGFHMSLEFMNVLFSKKPDAPILVLSHSNLEKWESLLRNSHFSQMGIVSFFGDEDSLETIEELELFFNLKEKGKYPKFDILIADYKAISKNAAVFSEVVFNGVIFDQTDGVWCETWDPIRDFSVTHRLFLLGREMEGKIEDLLFWCFSVKKDFFEEVLRLLESVSSSRQDMAEMERHKGAKKPFLEAVGLFNSLKDEEKEKIHLIIESLIGKIRWRSTRRAQVLLEENSSKIKLVDLFLPMTQKQVELFQRETEKYRETIKEFKRECIVLPWFFRKLRLISDDPSLSPCSLASPLRFNEAPLKGEPRKDEMEIEKEGEKPVLSYKTVFASSLFKEIKGKFKRLLVLSHFEGMLDIVEEKLKEEHMAYLRIEPCQTNEETQKTLCEFSQKEGSKPVILLMRNDIEQIRNVGVRLEVDLVLAMDSGFNLSQTRRLEEALGSYPLVIGRVFCKESIEERIQSSEELSQWLKENQKESIPRKIIKSIISITTEPKLTQDEEKTETSKDETLQRGIRELVEALEEKKIRISRGEELEQKNMEVEENEADFEKLLEEFKEEMYEKIKEEMYEKIRKEKEAMKVTELLECFIEVQTKDPMLVEGGNCSVESYPEESEQRKSKQPKGKKLRKDWESKSLELQQRTSEASKDKKKKIVISFPHFSQRMKRSWSKKGQNKNKSLLPTSSKFTQKSTSFKKSKKTEEPNAELDFKSKLKLLGYDSFEKNPLLVVPKSKKKQDQLLNSKREEQIKKKEKRGHSGAPPLVLSPVERDNEREYLTSILKSMSTVRRKAILAMICSFGMDFSDIGDFWSKLCSSTEPFLFGFFKNHEGAKFQAFEYFLALIHVMKNHERLPKTVIDQWYFGLDIEEVNIKLISLTIVKIKYIRGFRKNPEEFCIDSEYYESKMIKSFLQNGENSSSLPFDCAEWTNYDDYCLLKGVFEFGFGNWARIISNESIWHKQITTQSQRRVLLHVLFNKIEGEEISYEEFQKNQPEDVSLYVQTWVKYQANNMMNLAYECS